MQIKVNSDKGRVYVEQGSDGKVYIDVSERGKDGANQELIVPPEQANILANALKMLAWRIENGRMD